MSLLRSYEALSSSSSRADVARVLRSVIDAPPFTLTSPARETLVQTFLVDIGLCVGGGKHPNGRLTKKDTQTALLALKTLGRTTPCSRIIARRENLTILLNAAEKLRSSESDAADESLRCVANALLLVDDARTTWVEIHGADHCVTILEKTTSPNLIFLCCRILFLSTASSTSTFITTVLEPPRRRYSTSNLLSTARDFSHNDIVETIAAKIDILLPLISQSAPMSKEALTDILKFSFNLLCHWPKIANDTDISTETASSSKGKGKETKSKVLEDDSPVLGERWSNRLNGFLAPLRRAFLSLPTGAPSPLAPPMTHILHALLPIPINLELYTSWFPEASSHRDTSSKDSKSHHGRSSRSSSPGSSSSKEGKEGKEKGGAFDRAMSMLTPRISLSSRPSSPGASPTTSGGPSAAAGGSGVGSGSSSAAGLPMPGVPLGTPAVLTRASDLLNVSFEHYLPGAIDPDDKSVKQRCAEEDVELDHVLSPLVLLVTKLCKYNTDCRKALREQLLPSTLDRTTPLEGRADTLGRCIRLLSCINHQRLKDSAGELLFVLCDSDAQVLTAQIGYGNAAGYLFNRGLLAPPPEASGPSSGAAEDASSLAPGINPITGMVEQQPRAPAGAEMTEEEKEREAEKLFVLFERLEKAGGMENPIKKAMREGKMEKYEDARRKKEEGEDSD